MINKFINKSIKGISLRHLSINDFVESIERKTTSTAGQREYLGMKAVINSSVSSYIPTSIDFALYRSNIITPGVVDKVEAI